MNKTQIMGILTVFLVAGAGIASAQGWGAGQGLGDCDGDCKGPSEEEIASHQAEMESMREIREEMHQAVLDGDWETFLGLRDENNLNMGLHGAITEETFPKMTEIAVKMEEVKTLREELADELGVELPEKGSKGMGPGAKGFAKGARMGYRHGMAVGQGIEA